MPVLANKAISYQDGGSLNIGVSLIIKNIIVWKSVIDGPKLLFRIVERMIVKKV